MTSPVCKLPEEDFKKVRNGLVQFLQSSQKADNAIQERVTGWYVKGD